MELITTPDELRAAIAELAAETFIGFDTETTGLDPHRSQLRLLQFASRNQSYILDLFHFPPDALQPVLDLLAASQPIKVAHNAKFDAEFLRKHHGIRLGMVFDTYLASLLISAGNESDRHGLEPVAARYLNVEMDKSFQVSDWSGQLTESQLEYAARDAQILLPLREKLQEKLDELELMQVAKLEFDCVNAMAGMELAGIYLDADCWRAQVAQTKAAYDQAAAKLQKELSAGAPQMSLFEEATSSINLDSPTQIREALGRLGIKVESTSEWRLHNLAREHPVIALLLDYRGLSKSLSAYGLSLLDHINPVTGRIHASFRQIGSPTGRMGCTSPSLHQIPHEKHYRQCFRAPAGRKLVVADFSQIEMRILAEMSNDEALLAAFNSGEDLHRATAANMLNVPLEEVTTEQRSKAKGLNYGIIYGMGAEGLANRISVSTTEAEGLIQRYFAAYPGVARWLQNAADTAVRERRSRTMLGRLWAFSFDPTDRQQLGALKRVGKNAPIQGTGSDLFKRAVKAVDDRLQGQDAQIVHCIHDEIVVECDEVIAEKIARLVSSTMIKAGKEFLPRIPVEVDAKVTDAWLK
ncbi:MAG: bifunctional 3'-5' exonuclease/DNA polymerase [Acidobacteria bacterium]|nr:bifunctional 3'-5' exonuclease/DNA polymerase [Acidobacteriota bacterium]